MMTHDVMRSVLHTLHCFFTFYDTGNWIPPHKIQHRKKKQNK